ncbi:OTU family ubiquitin thioesterase [Sporobolomyces salmoneus]|uniref:OTU family ubiquitin thioesterase n=1 Tax=Sporobolomyces salmoneus TaxID=183962 RepID=UPI00317302B8
MDPSNAAPDLTDKKLGDLTDAEIAQLTASLKEEQAKERPLLGEVEPLERLLEEYQEGTGYRMKVKRLIEDGWSGIRRSRGDGDCFYRAFIFSLLSTYLSRPAALSAQLLSTFESLLPLLSACGFEEIVWSDFWEPLRDILRRMGPEEKDGGARKNGEARLGPGELFQLFNDQETNSCIIVHLRLLTSAYLRTHSDDFTPFLFALEDDPRFLTEGGAPTMENFCQFHVEPVNREADHLQIVALSRALGAPLRIAYLDQSGLSGVGGGGEGAEEGGGQVNFIEFEEERAKEDGIVSVEGALLYRPGHYDILYR